MKLTKVKKNIDLFKQPLDIIGRDMFCNGTNEDNIGLYDYGAGKYVFTHNNEVWLFESNLRGDKLYNEFEPKIIRLYKELGNWYDVFLVVVV